MPLEFYFATGVTAGSAACTAPGLRTWWAGTHHRASMAVEVDTPAGVVVASDAFFYRENVTGSRPLGIGESMAEGLACYERVRRVADHVVPLTDPRLLELYPDGVVARPPSY